MPSAIWHGTLFRAYGSELSHVVDINDLITHIIFCKASAKPEGSGALVWSCCSGWRKFDGSNANS
jgi:hypothetical protein